MSEYRYSEQLYDVMRDPSETNNIAQQKPRVVEQLKRNIMAAKGRRKLRKNTDISVNDFPPPPQKKRIKSLG